MLQAAQSPQQLHTHSLKTSKKHGILGHLRQPGQKKKRLSHIKNLLALTCTDGRLTEDEANLIFRMGINAGLTPEELNRILERPDSVRFYPPESYKERIEQLYDMIMVMMVDGEISERKVAFCKMVAMELGFSHEIIDQMVRDIIEMVARGIALEVALQRLGMR